MSQRVRDRIVGAILVAFAVAWCVTVLITVPTAYGDATVGPRDVPLWLGIGLGLLALILIVNSFFGEDALADDEERPRNAASSGRSEWLAIAVVAGSLIAYALLMEWFGFVVATIVVVGSLLRLGLNVRSLPVLLGMSLGMSFGVYFVMGGLMGVYLPHGTIISPF